MMPTSTSARASMPGVHHEEATEAQSPFLVGRRLLGEGDRRTRHGRALAASRRSTPAWSSWGMPPKGSPGCAAPGGPPPPMGGPAEHQRPPVRCASVPRSLSSSVDLGLFDRGGLGQNLRVQRRRCQELDVGAVGHDLPAVEQHDPVGQADRREAVRHDQGGPVLHEYTQTGVDPLFHLDVDGARGVVENQDGRVDQKGPCDGDALALAARERVPAFADDRVVALGQTLDESVRTGRGGGGDDLLVGGIGSPVGDVVADGDGEEEWLVEDHADVGPQAGQGEVADVVAVDEDRAARSRRRSGP